MYAWIQFLCFFQPSVPKCKFAAEFSGLFQFEFTNNSAEISGDNLYGGDVDQCFTVASYTWNSSQHYYKYWYFTDIFVIKERGPSWISSNAHGVCFCNIYNYKTCITKLHPTLNGLLVYSMVIHSYGYGFFPEHQSAFGKFC